MALNNFATMLQIPNHPLGVPVVNPPKEKPASTENVQSNKR